MFCRRRENIYLGSLICHFSTGFPQQLFITLLTFGFSYFSSCGPYDALLSELLDLWYGHTEPFGKHGGSTFPQSLGHSPLFPERRSAWTSNRRGAQPYRDGSSG